MGTMLAISAALAVLLLGYLAYAMIFPEHF